MKKGRTRNVMVYRTPKGRASEAGQEREFPPAQIKRLRDAAMAGLRDEEWGTELGRLLLANAITESMYAAGKKWSEMAAKYRGSIGSFPVRSVSLQSGRRGTPPDPDSPEGQKIAAREASQAERFFAADAVLMDADVHTPGVRQMVRRVCEDNEMPCGLGELSKLRTGLMRLVSHWHLTGVRKSDSRKNAR